MCGESFTYFSLILPCPSSTSVHHSLIFCVSSDHQCKCDVMLWVPSPPACLFNGLSCFYTGAYSLTVMDCFSRPTLMTTDIACYLSLFFLAFLCWPFLFACIILHLSLIERKTKLFVHTFFPPCFAFLWSSICICAQDLFIFFFAFYVCFSSVKVCV